MIRYIWIAVGICVATLYSCQKNQQHDLNYKIVQDSIGETVDSLLTPYIEELRRLTDNRAGLAVGITKGNKIIYANTFGYANIHLETDVNLNTIFHIASVSKPFTAAAIMALMEDGKLQLDDFLISFIPEFKMKGEGYEQITIKHILTHTSGIPRHISSGDWENPKVGPRALEKNVILAKEFSLDFPPGSAYNYSNSAFDLLGVIVERLSGKSFDEYVRDRILLPSGMDNTNYKMPLGILPQNWAAPYSYGIETSLWSPYPYTENYFPSSGIQTDILDMCRWGLLHLGRGKFQGYQFLKESNFEMLTTPHYETPWGDQIGLSWFLQSYLERPTVMHQGNDTGFEAFLTIYPEDSISISLLANRDFSRTGRIMNAAAEILFNQEPKEVIVSAKYQFAREYRENGLESAKILWTELKKDTTDSYYVNNDDLLSTGAVLEHNKNWKAAKEVLSYYVELQDDSPYAWRLLGNTYLNESDSISAKMCYLRALEINPEYQKAIDALNFHSLD